MLKLLRILMVLGLFINFLYLVSGVMFYKVASVDAYSIWLLKTKMLYFYGFEGLLELNNYPYSHPNYPIFLPVMFSFILKLLGFYSDVIILLTYPFLYLFIIAFAYKCLRALRLNQNSSLILVYLYSMFSPLLAAGGRKHAGEADIFILLINWIIVNFSLTYFENRKKDKYLFFIAILSSIASQIKHEGIFVSIVLLILPGKLSHKIFYFVLSVIPSLAWQFVILKLNLTSDFGFYLPSGVECVSRFLEILNQIVIEMLNYRNWYIFWPIFVLLIFNSKPHSLFQSKVMKPILIFLTLVFLSIYLLSTIEPKSYVASSIDRVLLQISPFFYLVFSLNMVSHLENRKLGKIILASLED